LAREKKFKIVLIILFRAKGMALRLSGLIKDSRFACIPAAAVLVKIIMPKP
jgi:hypothetical protein